MTVGEISRDGSTLKLETTVSSIQFQVSKGPIAVWIGLYQTENGADWAWMDGQPTGYFNWDKVDLIYLINGVNGYIMN